MSRINSVFLLKKCGTEEWKKSRVKIIEKQNFFCSFSYFLLPNLSLFSLLTICSLITAIAPTLPVLAMAPEKMAQTTRGQNPSQSNTIYVSSSRGNNSGDGSQIAPLRTITQALQFAEANTVILVAPGTYSAATGEVFPLMLKAEVILQGNPFDRGEKIILQGGGDFTSPTFNRQNVAVVAGQGSTLSGLTITNPNSLGYGLWIESSSPVVVKNTFKGNAHEGISIVGNSAPIVQENNFLENGATGITVAGNSQAEIRDNLFQETGLGVKVTEDAAPVVVGNKIIYNQDGIVIQGQGRPAIRGNYIEENARDGIVAIAQSLPDLGNSQEPGRNTIRNNGRYDLNNATDKNVIPAYGNIFSSDRLFGRFDLAGTTAVSRVVSPMVTENPQNPNPPPTIFESRPTAPPEANREPVAREERLLDRVLLNRKGDSSSIDALEIPVPLPENGEPEAEKTDLEERLKRIWGDRSRSNSGTIQIPVPPVESRRSRPLQWPRTPDNLPSNDAAPEGLLPVPSSDIPLGSGGYVPPGLGGVANSWPSNSGGSSSRNRPIPSGLRYRVVVSLRGSGDFSRLRAIVPDAFERELDGESVMQAGAFRDRGEADDLLWLLKRNGLSAKIVPFR